MKRLIAPAMVLVTALALASPAQAATNSTEWCSWAGYNLQTTLTQFQADLSNPQNYDYILVRERYDLQLTLPDLSGQNLVDMQTLIHYVSRVINYSGSSTTRLNRRINAALNESYVVTAWACVT